MINVEQGVIQITGKIGGRRESGLATFRVIL